jgi:Xaa-Pro aminopeptidase
VDFSGRRHRLATRLPDLAIDALLVTRLPNVRYLTGFTGSNGQVMVGSEKSVLLTDGRYTEQARREVPELERSTYTAFPPAFAKACAEAGLGRVGFESAGVTHKLFTQLTEEAEGVELVPVGDEVERMRWVKEPVEVELIERAQAIADECFDRILPKLSEGMTEAEVAFDIELTMRQSGAEAMAFDPIVAFGENAAEPHHRPTSRALQPGDLVKLDFGARFEGYHSDMTRTVAFGEPAPELRQIHDLVRRAQQAGVDAVRAGIAGGDADGRARGVVEEAGRGEAFSHSLGHGVGLEIHEGPSLRNNGEDVLPVGAVVTVEPGVYVPGLGGVRIEDMVLVTEDGCRNLAGSTRELVVL